MNEQHRQGIEGQKGRDRPARLASRARQFGLLLALTTASLTALFSQAATRRVTTIDALRQFPTYFHQQNVLIRAEFVERGNELVLHAGSQDLHVLSAALAKRGPVEVRGQLFDIGKMEHADPRLGAYAGRFKSEEWPRPGNELVLNVTGVMEAPVATSPTIRALVLDPAKFEGQTVTVLGNFRGRNLFGDLPEAPGKSKFDFVLTAAEGGVWVTGMRPRGRNFDLDIEKRMDTGRWLNVTGVVAIHRGLAMIGATSMTLAEAPAVTEASSEPALPPIPPDAIDVVFSSPTPDETDVSTTSTVRVQFSRGLRQTSLADQVRVTYVGGDAIPFKTTYDAATRSIQLTFAGPLQPYKSVKVELSSDIRAFDNGALKPWTLTFSVGSR